MGEKENRASILDSISNWLKLLGLIVLIGEVVILAAMLATPSEKPVFIIYPIIMILLLIVVIGAYFYDRYLNYMEYKLNYVTLKVGDKELSINTSETFSANQSENKDYFHNSILGYSFHLPKGNDWSEPQEITYAEFLKKVFISMEDLDVKQLEFSVSMNNPFAHIIFNSKIIEIQYGNDIIIELDEQSTTDSIELQIKKIKEFELSEGREFTEEQIIEHRQRLFKGDIDKLGFAVKMNVMVMDKSDYKDPSLKLTLPNLFYALTTSSKEPIDAIIANEDLILWNTDNKLRNVLINNSRNSSMYISRTYQLLENKKYIYLCTIQWSPQSEFASSKFDSLKKMIESFKIKK